MRQTSEQRRIDIMRILEANRGTWIRQQQIADALGVRQQTISKRIAELRKMGKIRREARRGYQVI